jgi:hypothetical protein
MWIISSKIFVVPNLYKFIWCKYIMAKEIKKEKKEVEITHTPLKSDLADMLLESLLKRRAELFTRLA